MKKLQLLMQLSVTIEDVSEVCDLSLVNIDKTLYCNK